jgi:signal transduction histidine kinase/CheY-like chemotaxis protein
MSVWMSILLIAIYLTFYSANCFLYILIPLMLWASVRFNPYYNLAVIILLTITMLVITLVYGVGPFVMPNVIHSLSLQIISIASTVLTVLFITNTLRELKQAETVVREHEHQLAQFLEAMPVGIAVVDAEGKPFYANQRAKQLLGEGVKQHAFFQQAIDIYPVYQSGTDKLYSADKHPIVRALRGESSTIDDMEIRHAEKSIALEAWGTPIVDEQERIVYALMAFQDITEQKRVQEIRQRYTEELTVLNQQLQTSFITVRESEHRLTQILDAVPVGIGVVDASGMPYYTNQKARHVLGEGVIPGARKSQELYPVYIAGTSYRYPSNDQPIVRALKGETSSADNLEIRQTNKVIPLETWATPIFNEQGNISYAVVAFQDITERKQLEENRIRYTQQLAELNKRLASHSRTLEQEVAERTNELKVQTEEALRANQAKSRFLAAASHDLRQPLHALTLFVEALEQQVTDVQSRALVEKIQQSLEVMSSQFNSLLDISRLDAGIIIPHLQPIWLANLFKQLEDEFASSLAEKGLSFQVTTTGDIWLKSDLGLLQRILRNLLTNALKFTDQGGIQLQSQRRENWVEIAVIDTGIGIPADQHEEIFVEFHQLHNPERDRTKGLGLGLSIVKRLVQLLNHPLTLTSTPGKGSTFTITVPVIVKEANATPHLVSDAGKVVATEELLEDAEILTGIILVIDDEEIIRKFTGEHLKRWGHQIILVDTIENALQQLADTKMIPDVIIADYRLREQQTGIQAVELMRNYLKKNIPSILITGDTAPEVFQLAQQSGYKLLHKPIKPAHLRKLISYYLRKAKSEAQKLNSTGEVS